MISNCNFFNKIDYPPVIFNNDISKPGLYYLETDKYCPLRGNGWYSQAMVNYCISENIIELTNINYVIYSSLSIPADYYNKFIEFLNKNKKGEDGKPFNLKFVIWDILVYESNYLVGSTIIDRLTLLENLYPCTKIAVDETHMNVLKHVCFTCQKK
jgi:hypothetical protein